MVFYGRVFPPKPTDCPAKTPAAATTRRTTAMRRLDGRQVVMLLLRWWAPMLQLCFLLQGQWRAQGHMSSSTSTSYTLTAANNEIRRYNGTGNNLDRPFWGSVGQPQIRHLVGSSYTDGISTPPGDDRPTPREILSEVFLSAPPSSSTTSALFVGWALLVGYDIVLNADNASEPFNIECNDPPLLDVWCPYGPLSEDIPFERSDSAWNASGDGARSPINYATAYVDLDWLYGRDEDTASKLRLKDGTGRMNLTDDELPHQLANGTWLVADQRPASFPVTFAIQTVLLREHNRCCVDMAVVWGADSDEDYYQYCRQWTIAVFSHITENDFAIKLLGGGVKTLGVSQDYVVVPPDTVAGTYNETVDAGADVFFSTVALPAFFSALPPTVGLLDDGFGVMDEDGIELAAASADLSRLVERAGGIEPILRGAAYARTQAVDASFTAEVSVSSPLFNLPVEVVNRGRDHGIPSYNDARTAYGLDAVKTFASITSDEIAEALLSTAHGGDLDLLDAYTGAVAETVSDGSALFVGPLIKAAYLDQLYRSIVGDRHHHSHTVQNEDAALSTLGELIMRNANVSTMPTDVFTAPEVEASNSSGTNSASLAEGYKIQWNISDSTTASATDIMSITLSARGIGTLGMIAIGFGGQTMTDATDFIICEVTAEDDGTHCQDRQSPGERTEPPIDDVEHEYQVTEVAVNGEWTSVTFVRPYAGDDDSDYDLTADISNGEATDIIYAWRSGPGVGQHPNTQRGAAVVDLSTGDVDEACDNSTDFYALHGALILLAWMVVAPYGIYQARYRKGKHSFLGNLWWEMHEECMIVCAEALIPLTITAIVTTGPPHTSQHAKWGFYMLAAVVFQLATGWMRVRGLEAKGSNFSLFHRANKHLHIYSGWFAYAAGLVQCYRGVELVSETEDLIFSAIDINFKFANFGVVRKYVFPIWLAIVPPLFFVIEVRKQYRRYFTKGKAYLCGIVELINEKFTDEAIKQAVEDRLMPRTEELPIYTTQEFNEKVLNGRSWVIVDGAVLDVSTFAKRHPGGARLILNAMGTDVTSEIMGEEASIGNMMSFSPHRHTDVSLEIARSLVVGYMDEDDDTEAGSCAGHDSLTLRNNSSSASGGDLDSSDAWSSGRGGGGLKSSGSEQFLYRSPQWRAPTARDSRGVVSYGDRGARLAYFSSDDDSTATNLRLSPVDISVGPEARKRMYPMRRRVISDALSGSASSGGDETPTGRNTTSSGQRKIQVGPSVTLSQAAAEIVDAPSPPPPPSPGALRDVGKQTSKKVIRRSGTAPVVFGGSAESAARTAAGGGYRSKAPAQRSTSSISGVLDRPKALAQPVPSTASGRSRSDEEHSAGTPTRNRRRSFSKVGRLMRKMSSMDTMTSENGTETSREGETRQFKATKRVWQQKNPLSFFHVCPLLLHERMNKSSDRPVYKFVFSCPGKAKALAHAITGVCHFNMRLAQEDGKVVQRSYNAFAVRLVSKEGEKRQVLPFHDTSEGEACIEMRIRLYPDGAMSNLLKHLIKNADNPAVQLQGPFLQDKLIPPPAHRNIIMIAAGTGVNPMVQMIRDYLHLDPSLRDDGALGTHTRLVLLWQNTMEVDLYGVAELTKLQAKSGGLLEVAALVSGDLTRRNVPGAAFRKAKAKLVAMGVVDQDHLDPAREDGKGDGDVETGRVLGVGSKKSRSRQKPRSLNTPSKGGKSAAAGGGAAVGVDGDRSAPTAAGRSDTASGHGRRGESKQDERDDEEEEKEHAEFTELPLLLDQLGPRGLSRVIEEDMSYRSSRATSGTASREGSRKNLVSGEPVADSLGRSRGSLVGGEPGDSQNDMNKKSKALSPFRSTAALGATASKTGDDDGMKDRSGGVTAGTTGDAEDDGIFRPFGHVNFSALETTRTAPLSPSSAPVKVAGNRDRGQMLHRSVGMRLRASQDAAGRMKSHSSSGSAERSDCSSSGETRSGGESGRVRGWPDKSIGGGAGGSARDGGSAAAPPAAATPNKGSANVSGSKKKRPAALAAGARGECYSSTSDEAAAVERPKSRASRSTRLAAQKVKSSASQSRGGGGRTKETAPDPPRSKSRSKSASSCSSPLDSSGTGLRQGKVSKDLLKTAFGEPVRKTVAATHASAVGAPSLETAARISRGARDAMRDLCGTPISGGQLQIVVSGPAGFVFHVESILGEMRIPPEVVVLLD